LPKDDDFETTKEIFIKENEKKERIKGKFIYNFTPLFTILRNFIISLYQLLFKIAEQQKEKEAKEKEEQEKAAKEEKDKKEKQEKEEVKEDAKKSKKTQKVIKEEIKEEDDKPKEDQKPKEEKPEEIKSQKDDKGTINFIKIFTINNFNLEEEEPEVINYESFNH
jgi:flagellar biosynthesis component FlhA